MGVKLTIIGVIIIIVVSASIIGFYFLQDENDDDHVKEVKIDTDNDMIPDQYDTDDDNDGIDDEWEIKYGLDSKSPDDKYEDKDLDGVDNKNEFDTNTDPTNPNDFNSEMKTNLDLYGVPLSQNASFLYGNITDNDFDDDGLPDLYELNYEGFLDPTDPTDANLDYDRDGRTMKAEYDAGTDPTDACYQGPM